jgi:hypothetical protein
MNFEEVDILNQKGAGNQYNNHNNQTRHSGYLVKFIKPELQSAHKDLHQQKLPAVSYNKKCISVHINNFVNSVISFNNKNRSAGDRLTPGSFCVSGTTSINPDF